MRLGEPTDQAFGGEGGVPDLFFGYVADAQRGGCDGVAFGVRERVAGATDADDDFDELEQHVAQAEVAVTVIVGEV